LLVMSLDERQRSPGTYDGPPGQTIIQEMLKMQVSELSSEDKEALKHATKTFVQTTALGTLAGGLGGIALAFRGKWHPSQWSKLAKLFPNGVAGGGHNAEALRERFAFGLRAIGYGAAGVLVGQSAGIGIGTWRSSQVLKREGNYERITEIMKKMSTEMAQRSGGAPPGELGRSGISSQQRRKLQGQPASLPTEDGENTRLARSFEHDAPRDNQAWGETAFAQDTSASSSDLFAVDRSPATPAANNEPKKRTRWEELRGSRSGQDSAWERIRQENARRDHKPDTGRDADASFSNDRPSSETFSEEQQRNEDEQRRRMSREKERQEYEKMFEKESRGEDSIYRAS